jgi:hypothetical protein
VLCNHHSSRRKQCHPGSLRHSAYSIAFPRKQALERGRDFWPLVDHAAWHRRGYITLHMRNSNEPAKGAINRYSNDTSCTSSAQRLYALEILEARTSTNEHALSTSMEARQRNCMNLHFRRATNVARNACDIQYLRTRKTLQI